MAVSRKTTTKTRTTAAKPVSRAVKSRATTSAREVSSGGGMTVREAGRKGGLIGGKKGGETVLRERGPGFYSEIGKKGGQRVRELIERGKTMETPAPTGRARTTSARATAAPSRTRRTTRTK
jgi:general stress protein YciG